MGDIQKDGKDAKVYANSDQKKYNVLYGGKGKGDGPGHGHAVFDQDMKKVHDRPPFAKLGQVAVTGKYDPKKYNK